MPKENSRNADKKPDNQRPIPIGYFEEPCDVCGVWPCVHTDPNSWSWRNAE